MIYDFKCAGCGEERSAEFPINDYDKYVTQNGKLKRKRCKKCSTISLYRHTIGGMSVAGEDGEVCIITIHFRCQHCDHTQPLDIKTDKAFYQIQSQYLDEDKRSITERCGECESDQIFYHSVGQAPAVLGGTKGYMSMERYQQLNPDNYKRKEEELQTKMADRHRKRVLDKINKEAGGGKRQNRHEGYGKGQGEKKLRND